MIIIIIILYNQIHELISNKHNRYNCKPWARKSAVSTQISNAAVNATKKTKKICNREQIT